MEPARPRRRELDDLGQRPGAALLREPEQRDEDLRGRQRIGQAPGGTARTTCRRSARAGSSENALAPAAASSRRASQTVSTTGAATRRPVSRSTARSRKPTSKRALCATSGASPANPRKRRTASSDAGRAAQRRRRRIPVSARDRAAAARRPGGRASRSVSSISSAAHPHRADLAHAIAARREPGRLEVEDDELGVLDERPPPAAPPRGRRAPPSQASRASPSTTSARSEWASVAGARSSAKSTRAASSAATAPRRAWTSSTSRSAASNESCIARHRSEHMFVFKGKRKAATRGGLLASFRPDRGLAALDRRLERAPCRELRNGRRRDVHLLARRAG